MTDHPEEPWSATWLGGRRFEPCSEDFAQRIIMASTHIPQKMTLPIIIIVQRSFAELIPRPAYVLTLVLLLGVTIGLISPTISSGEDDPASTTEAFLYEEGNNL